MVGGLDYSELCWENCFEAIAPDHFSFLTLPLIDVGTCQQLRCCLRGTSSNTWSTTRTPSNVVSVYRSYNRSVIKVKELVWLANIQNYTASSIFTYIWIVTPRRIMQVKKTTRWGSFAQRRKLGRPLRFVQDSFLSIRVFLWSTFIAAPPWTVVLRGSGKLAAFTRWIHIFYSSQQQSSKWPVT